ncbi:hypothetical protein SLEP1_g14934 [Rubroshorea leprosula]|uniref:Uncharacterized protein n=1 Tax=Rubroshorea leprosula TaxID=152421 RepID=A0AAV5IRU0_9ROSI|nr:hypothetical protein SLEP1_g14934 [Rubroshorea leprosula]
MKTRLDKSICPWWNGSCLFEVLDAVEIPPRDPNGPFRKGYIVTYNDSYYFLSPYDFDSKHKINMGTVVMGKFESGTMHEGDSLLVMPNKVLGSSESSSIYCDEDKATRAGPSENLWVKLSGIEEEDILSGFVLCSVANNLICVERFSDFAQLGRFTLRTEGKTVAVGKVMDIPSSAIVHKKVLLLEVRN